jgi:hypothetical protein
VTVEVVGVEDVRRKSKKVIGEEGFAEKKILGLVRKKTKFHPQVTVSPCSIKLYQ